MKTDTQKSPDTPIISCEHCSKDVPFTPESEEYVAYYCGLSCYTEWKKKHNISDQKEKTMKTFVYNKTDD